MPEHSQPMVIGLLGGIGSGKSTVGRILAEEGCVVSDADAIVRNLLDQADIRSELISWWGEDILKDGRIDRPGIARVVFADSEQRARLEGLLHPRVEEERRRMFAEAGNARALVIDAPLLLEVGLDDGCDVLVFVDTPQEHRVARVKDRGWTSEDLDAREKAQWPLDRKRQVAHYVLVNDGDFASLRRRTIDLLQSLAPRTCDGDG